MPILNRGIQVDVEETCGGCPMLWEGTVHFPDQTAPLMIYYRYWCLVINVGACEIFRDCIDTPQADSVAFWDEVEPYVMKALANVCYITLP